MRMKNLGEGAKLFSPLGKGGDVKLRGLCGQHNLTSRKLGSYNFAQR